MKRLRFILLWLLVPAMSLAVTACGETETDPQPILDRALSQEKLVTFVGGPLATEPGTVAVQSLGYEDRVLNERLVEAEPPVMNAIRSGLGAKTGLRDLINELSFDGSDVIDGVVVNHVSGQLDVAGLADALTDAGGEDVASLAGPVGARNLRNSLVEADFDIYAGEQDGVIRQLDLTLAIDDQQNALPPTRIRFVLTPGVFEPVTE